MEKINDNAYKIDLQGKYQVSPTFNVSDLSTFCAGPDSRKNPFQEEGNDVTLPDTIDEDATIGEDLLELDLEGSTNHEVSRGPITRAKAKRLNQMSCSMPISLYVSPK